MSLPLVGKIGKAFRKKGGDAPSSDSGGLLFDAFLGGKRFAKKQPLVAGIGALGLGGMIAEPLREGIASGYTDRDLNRRISEIKSQGRRRAAAASLSLRQEQVERELATQAARLAAANPQLYNQIVAGRRLPQGAVILGGNPRTDLMEQIASSMASSPALQNQPGPSMAPQDQFLNELGV